jgi:enoyl-CoA hydratase
MNRRSGPSGLTDDEEVLVEREGRIGRLVLNRPRAINALTHGMVRRIDQALTDWERDDDVAIVLITGAGDRGLCSGGDIRVIYQDARSDAPDRGEAARAFWRDEYLLNGRIARYPKPYVALMDGITMGGGVGISAHGNLRVVTERSVVAMPETGIGLSPDVGGSYLLAQAPGELGTHLALTAGSFSAADALLCGFADVFIPSDRLKPFRQALIETDPAEAARTCTQPAPEGELAAHRDWIDACYCADTAEEIVERLRGHGGQAAKEAADRICRNSPTAVKVTLRALRRARELGRLEPVLDQEYRLSCAALDSPDLVEGIRAQVIDKDRRPRWSPPSLTEVTGPDVDRFFAPIGDRELGLWPDPDADAGTLDTGTVDISTVDISTGDISVDISIIERNGQP